MYEPIRFIKNNECPHCGKIMQLVDIDITVNAIDSDGKILSGIKDSKTGNQFFLYCTSCKTKYDTEKYGQFVRIKRKEQSLLGIKNPLYDK